MYVETNLKYEIRMILLVVISLGVASFISKNTTIYFFLMLSVTYLIRFICSKQIYSLDIKSGRITIAFIKFMNWRNESYNLNEIIATKIKKVHFRSGVIFELILTSKINNKALFCLDKRSLNNGAEFEYLCNLLIENNESKL